MRTSNTLAPPFFRLAGGRIEDAWVVGDTQELWRALGVPPVDL